MRNENQEFFDQRYAKLKDFLYNADRNVVKFCSNAIQESCPLINSTEASLKQNMKKIGAQEH